jgi:fructose PTS system EIIBC or EIIC component
MEFFDPERMGPLLVLSIILLAGAGGGWVAGRLRCPQVTGNIIAGAILGVTIFHAQGIAQALQPLSTFAMGLICVSAGGQLSYRRIRTALRRILSIAILEAISGFALVTVVAWWLVGDWTVALLLGTIAVASAPATVVALLRENRAKGTYVKTLLSVVALDNIICIALFALVQTLVAGYPEGGAMGLQVGQAIVSLGAILGGSLVLGLGLGWVIERTVHRHSFHNFSTVVVAILLGEGLSDLLRLNPLMTCLFMGTFLGNRSREAEEQLFTLTPLEPLLYTCFFTLAGVALHVDSLLLAGEMMLGYLVARAVGKAIGTALGGAVGRCSRRIWTNIPLGLVPQAGVAIGLVVLLEGDPRIPAETSSFIGAIVLAAVTVSELIGPLLAKLSLVRAKEAGRDRPRLVEFLEEEFILTDLRAADKWDALRQMTDFLVKSHRVAPSQRESIYASVVEREEEMTTAIGLGAAIPHGRLESGPGIQGVLGISREGVPFDAPDGDPVRLIMLIVTPKEHEQRHLEVIASLAAMVSDDAIRERLIAAIDANDAWEVIEGEETRNYNYFIEDGPALGEAGQ